MRKTEIDKPITPFNKKAEYESRIQPLITELVKLCTIYDIPMYVTCCVANSETGSEFKNQAVSPDVRGLNLADDDIQKHLCLQLGFDTVYRRNEEFDDYEDGATKIST